MRIDSKLDITPIHSESREASTRPEIREGSAATVVTLSAAGARAVEARDDNDIAARLTKIKSMIDAGHYPVDLEKLAERIADDEMLRTRSPK